jgi:hypothetical protein
MRNGCVHSGQKVLHFLNLGHGRLVLNSNLPQSPDSKKMPRSGCMPDAEMLATGHTVFVLEREFITTSGVLLLPRTRSYRVPRRWYRVILRRKSRPNSIRRKPGRNGWIGESRVGTERYGRLVVVSEKDSAVGTTKPGDEPSQAKWHVRRFSLSASSTRRSVSRIRTPSCQGLTAPVESGWDAQATPAVRTTDCIVSLLAPRP